VTKEYIAGKRSNYSNPFRFYFTVSIVFFLILGLSTSKTRFEKLSKESKTNIVAPVKKDKKKAVTNIELDSIKDGLDKKMQASIAPFASSTRDEIIKEIEKSARDTTNQKKINSLSFGGLRIDKFIDFQNKNPNTPVDEALDSLGYAKNFKNRFVYDRAQLANSVIQNEHAREKFIGELISYGSVSLFIFLPIFTLFLGLLYLRRKFSYVAHLIFVFHTQTVFFMLLCILYLISFFMNIKTSNTGIFGLLFLVYLFIAMKKFYGQGYFKTGLKFLVLNFIFLMMGSIGFILVGLVSFALY
jgi:hypothetical protein